MSGHSNWVRLSFCHTLSVRNCLPFHSEKNLFYAFESAETEKIFGLGTFNCSEILGKGAKVKFFERKVVPKLVMHVH